MAIYYRGIMCLIALWLLISGELCQCVYLLQRNYVLNCIVATYYRGAVSMWLFITEELCA